MRLAKIGRTRWKVEWESLFEFMIEGLELEMPPP